MGDWLTLRHALHAVFAVALLLLVFRKAWSLLVRRAIDTQRLARAARRGKVSPAMALEVLWGVSAEDGLRVAIREAIDLDRAGLSLIQGLNRLLMSVSFVLCVYELIWLVSGDHGLLSLRAGYVERLAMGRIAVHLALGLGGVAVGTMAHRRLCMIVRGRSKILRSWLPSSARLRRTKR